MDSAGYRVLVGASEYAVRRGHTLLMTKMSSSYALLVRLCDPDHELRIEPFNACRGVNRARNGKPELKKQGLRVHS